MSSILSRRWKTGALVFAVVLGLCLISIWQRQTRYNLVFTFPLSSVIGGVELRGLNAGTSRAISERLGLLLQERKLRAGISEANGVFTITATSITASTAEDAQKTLAAAYEQLVEQFSKGADPGLLSAQLAVLDKRLDRVAQMLKSAGLSPYEVYSLEDRALALTQERDLLRRQIETVATNQAGAPAANLYRAAQMDGSALLALALTLSAFVGCAAMLLADSISRRA